MNKFESTSITIEICDRCGGHGILWEQYDPMALDEVGMENCPDCKGSGRLICTITTKRFPFQ